MCKRILTIIAIVLAVYGLASANTADVDQTSPDNEVRISQNGSEDNATVNQTAGVSNDATIEQTGDYHNATVTQPNAGGTNTANIEQDGGDDDYICIVQATIGTGSNNDTDVIQYGKENDITIFQDNTKSGGDNKANIYQGGAKDAGGNPTAAGNNNEVNIDQDAAGINPDTGYSNFTDIEQIGHRNRLVGASLSSVLTEEAAAVQKAGTYNTLALEQIGSDNTVGLYQEAGEYNAAEIHQLGDYNLLVAYQTSAAGYNELTVNQIGTNSANICQQATTGNNKATIDQ